MSEKPIARLGDPGSHGGCIITGTTTIMVNGKPMARIGDMYACPKHGTNPIVTGANSVFGQGQIVAHVGSKTACGAIISSGSPNVFVDDKNTTLHTFNTIDLAEHLCGCGLFILLDERDNSPLANINYSITTAGGKHFSGTTGKDGKTEIVFGSQNEQISISIDGEGTHLYTEICEI